MASFEMGEQAREKAIHKSRFFRAPVRPGWGGPDEAGLTPADGARILEAVKAKAGVFYDDARRAGCYESSRLPGRRPRVPGRRRRSRSRNWDRPAHGDTPGGPGCAPARGLDHESTGDTAEMCEIAGLGPISLATASRVLGDAYVKLVISDGADVRNVCHLGRSVPAPMKTALEHRYPVCSVPRCDNHYYLENHHLVPVAQGGPTSLDNLVRICKWHHDLITYERWRLTGRPGAWAWHRPPDFDGL